MAIDLIPDTGEEIIREMKELNVRLKLIKEMIEEKDKRILELEEKLKKSEKNGS
ncbi:MAG TPA: hypothetical protein VJ438_00335 [Candidatus Nanoarchaeia archaeon]|nr:hypothetical protein [Candidatus Nanoarchaeia archaeon]